MVRHTKWISLLALGLILVWQHLPAQAQRFSFDGQTVQIHPAEDDDDQNTDDNQLDRDESDDGEHHDADGDADKSDAKADDDDHSEFYEKEIDVKADEMDDDSAPDDDDVEVIKERFPDGKVRIEREVTQDAAGNYLNHGPWKMWDQAGNLVAQGQYRYGERTGTWIRWYRSVSEAPLLRAAPFKDFAGPFVSQATFQNGQLNGYWTIYDGKLRKISQWQFVDGRRHGLSVWWHGNGRKMREIQFRDGDIDGHLVEWGPEGSVLIRETYQAGRKLAQKTEQYRDGKQKKSEGMYLFAKDAEKTADDWWNCKLVTTVKTGKDERHGPWTGWHQNGQRQLEGTYEHDLQVGLFTWWHSNGQKALEGHYETGKQDGEWTWWYQNGQKSIQGQYVTGNPTGRWTWWGEDGRVAQSADLSQAEGVVIQQMPSDKPAVLPQVRKPTPRKPVRR